MNADILRGIRMKTFSAQRLVPEEPLDGTTLEERFNAWASLPENKDLKVVGWEYQSDGTQFTLVVLYTK